jgi:PAS domain S-box-containing protein
VNSARDGAAALDAAIKYPPDLIIADILMPVMDGFELCRKWKADERLNHIPFIFYTATYTDPKDEQFALSLGAERFVVKPQKPDVLGQIVREVLKEARNKPSAAITKSLIDETETLQQYNEVLFHKLERKVIQLETEIASHREAEEALRESGRMLQEAQEMAHLGFWSWDIRTGRVEWSDEVFRIFGLDPVKFIPQIDSILALSPWEGEQQRARELIRKAGESHEPGSYEQRFLRPDKSTGYYQSTFQGRYDDGGNLISIVGTVLDITDRKVSENALRESEIRFRTMVDWTYDWEYWIDKNRKFIHISPSVERITGYTVQEFMADKELIDRIIHPDDRRLWEAHVPCHRDECGTNPFEIELRIINKDGSLHWISHICRSIFSKDGTWLGRRVSNRDITDRKRADEKLIQSESRYRKLYESMMDAFLRVDMAGQILEYNRAFMEMLGYSKGELSTLTYEDLTPEKWRAFEKYVVQTQILPLGYSSVYEKEYRKKDGTVFPVELRTFLIRDDSGIPTGMWAIVRDITERKRSDERIRLANRKLALMSDVTYQDIQNKVTALRGYVEFSRNAASENDRLTLIEKETATLETIHALIKKTKDYQQMGVDQSRWILLEQTIQQQMSLQSPKRNVSLKVDLGGLEIYSDPLIDRVFYNLIHNALQYGEKLTRISFCCHETSDGLLLICEDDGIGIPLEQKSLIFERIVGGVGTFGLFFVREFLTISGMTIAETGNPGTGARFEIAVPKGVYRFSGGR